MNDFNVLGEDLFGDPVRPKTESITNKRFIFPPFTILDAKQGEWQERKRMWKSLGVEGELGRGDELLAFSETILNENPGLANTSIFDPVLCELAYRWFSPEYGQIVDPFAGGSVRGIVAKSLNRKYWGCDLRDEQVVANIKQAEDIFEGYDGESGDMFGDSDLQWITGDSMKTLETAPKADFIFTCPPYGDLEVYSDDPNDLSNMEYHTFIAAYKRIILRACQNLKENRFACIVVGDFRDKKGFYRNFVSETITAFEDCEVRLYNEAILATAIGSASMRVTKQFNASRKLAKIHQNVLVFCKGDPKKAVYAIENAKPGWHDTPQTKKGDIGEQLVEEYLASKGLTIYRPVTNQAHPCDRIVVSRDKKRFCLAEVKSYARRKFYNDTGINTPHFHEYKASQDAHNMPLYLFFVDEEKGKIYGGLLDHLSQPYRMPHKGDYLDYPLTSKARNGDLKTYFPMELMEEVADIPTDYRNKLIDLTTKADAYLNGKWG